MPLRPRENSKSKGAVSGVLELFQAFWQRKSLVLIPTCAMCLASATYVHLVTPRYLAQAKILVEEGEASASRADGAVDALLVRLAMPDVANKVIADLGLQRRGEFDPLIKGIGVAKSIVIGAGFAPDPRVISKQERVQNAYFERLLVERVGTSRVVNVGFQSQDGELAASIANRIAEEALRAGAPERALQAGDPAEIIRKLADVEARIVAARQANPGDSVVPAPATGDVSPAMRAQQADLQSRASMVREAVRLGRIAEITDVTSQEGVKKLLEQRAQIKGQIALDERTLPPTHPRMKEAYTQLNSLDSQLRMVADRVARGFENEARTLAARGGGVDPSSRTTTQPARESQIAALEQEAQTLRDQLAKARAKAMQDAAPVAGDAGSGPSAKIIARAVPQKTPFYPNKLSTILGATLATFLASLGFVFFLHLVFRKDQAEAEDVEPQPVVHAVAANSEDDEHSPKSFAWARNLLRPEEGTGAVAAPSPTNQNTRGTVLPGQGTPIAQPPVAPAPEQEQPAMREAPSIRQEGSGIAAAEEISRELSDMGYLGRGKISILYGLERDARTSLHAIRLGRRLVKEGSAIVVELFGQDNLYTRVAGQNLAGLGAYLDGEVSIADIIHRDARSKLHILPAGEPLTHRIFGQSCQDQLEALVHALCQSYAHIIVDAGPIGAAGEMLSALADAIIIVTQGDGQSASLTKAIKRFEAAGGSPVFVVMDEFKDVAVDQQANAPRIVGVVRR